jgi:hypothetical protein
MTPAAKHSDIADCKQIKKNKNINKYKTLVQKIKKLNKTENFNIFGMPQVFFCISKRLSQLKRNCCDAFFKEKISENV